MNYQTDLLSFKNGIQYNLVLCNTVQNNYDHTGYILIFFNLMSKPVYYLQCTSLKFITKLFHYLS